ncbi:MAG: hypothetical protein L0387_21170 [Acidobacteria bacterium]|nr:hypothetical protein [Acidobacteriota bacterium]MCI0722347.1 hypothetical protein [Acidobacteriota bacterium]
MIYIEYYSRRQGIGLKEFYEAIWKGQDGWGAGFQEDQLVWAAARTWRMGPHPAHMGVWYSPNFGFERMDAWERIFRAGEADAYEEPFLRVSEIEMAGCYDALIEPARVRNANYYAEFFRATGKIADVQKFYQKRAEHYTDFTLILLVHRIGRLGPDPGGLAVWTLPNFASLEKIAR